MKRRTVLTAALLATLVTSAWVAALPDPEGSAAVEAVERPASREAGALRIDAAPASPRAHERSDWGAPPRAALAAWSAPPAPRPTPAASAPPRAPLPKFPYAWIGRLEDGGDVQVLLNGAERSFGARAGDVLDGRWRIERVAGTRLQLSWLPTGETVNVELR